MQYIDFPIHALIKQSSRSYKKSKRERTSKKSKHTDAWIAYQRLISEQSNLPLRFPLNRSHRNDRALFPERPANLGSDHADEITRDPIAAMRTQHGQVLNLQGPAAVLHEVINLAVVVQRVGALLSDLFTREIVGFELDVGRHARHGGLEGDGGFRCAVRAFERIGEADPGRGGARNEGCLQIVCVVGIDRGVEAVRNGVVWVYHVVDVIQCKATIRILVSGHAWAVRVRSPGLLPVVAREKS